jgi:hypothetical protein
MLAEKIASHLAEIAAEARVSQGVQRFHEKRASKFTKLLQQLPTMLQSGVRDLPQRLADNPMGYGAGLGALGGSALGGGSTALANLFREKKDRESIFNNTLLGGVAGGALGLSGGAAYKALQETPETEPKKLVTKSDVRAARNDETIPDKLEAAKAERDAAQKQLNELPGSTNPKDKNFNPNKAQVAAIVDKLGTRVNLLNQSKDNKENSDLVRNPVGTTLGADVNTLGVLGTASGITGTLGYFSGNANDRVRQLWNATKNIGISSDKSDAQKEFAKRIYKLIGDDFDPNAPGADTAIWKKLKSAIGVSRNPFQGTLLRPEVVTGPPVIPPPPPPVSKPVVPADLFGNPIPPLKTEPEPTIQAQAAKPAYSQNVKNLLADAEQLGVKQPRASRAGRTIGFGVLPPLAYNAFNYLTGGSAASKKLDLGVNQSTAATLADQNANTEGFKNALRFAAGKPLSK